ncbi:uncharacterized protein DUF3953 [Aneurinibacillus soli]|uniref:Uncharacterized protein n=1 Tax=Aneurinibacillus soli TaxID=1500254 RepID=A0A0U5B6S8_9BACL|nr:uncharacterized protein DUF3953 [Aneurinibacillus soli]BAU29119.1 hypothetical protein CB4_03297 [Aneurinibacillus soli]
MKKWIVLNIIQLLLSLIVLLMSTINVLMSPTHDYFPGFVVQFFLGVLFGVIGLNQLLQKQTRFAIFCFIVMIFSLFASFYIFNVQSFTVH